MLPTAEQVRALKDEDYRLTLGQGHQLHPAGDPAGEVYVTAAVQNSTCDSYSSCARLCSY
ncbi:hypothetical protein [Kitasatospora sp. NPDC050463]|uniref:hypothetical protein n=1 Tax=unclassified Kitasatospora TaxID=2633591 RepID=UPI0033C2757F